MGIVAGAAFGIGLLLVVREWSAPPIRAPRSRSRLAALLDSAGLQRTSPRSVLLAAAGAAAAALVLAVGLSGIWALGLIAALAAAWTPVAYLRSRAMHRQRAFADAWPAAVDHLASAVRAGLSLPEALIQLGERGPEDLREPFRRFGIDYGSSGRFVESLDLLKARLADPVGDRVVEALRIAREVGGGDLGRLLRSLSGFLRDDLRTRGELESRQSWTIGAARLAVAAPWLVLLTMSLQRDVIARFATPAGVAVLASSAVVCVVSYRVMLRLGRLPADRRILA